MNPIIIILLLINLFGCQKPNHSRPQTLRLNISSDPYTLDPRCSADKISLNIDFLLFEGLTRQTQDSTRLALAEKVDISADQKTYLFHLRKSFWSDGHPVIAQDFESAWKKILDPLFLAPNAALFYVIKNAEAAKRGLIPLSEVGVKALDERTLLVELEYPTPYFLELLSFCSFFPYPQHSLGEQFVSNGPFQLVHWKENDELLLSKNPLHWEKDKVKLSEIKISIVSCANTAYEMYMKKELDFIGLPFISLPREALPQLIKKNLIEIKPIAATMICGFNTKRIPFTNANIRKALAFAINRQVIVDHVTLLNETPATNLICPLLKKNENDSLFKDADIELAKDLFQQGLQELNSDPSIFEKVELTYLSDELNHRIAQAIQQQWKEAFNITIKLVKAEHKSYLNTLGSSDFDIVHAVWFAQFNDPINILERFKFEKNTKNYIRWEHPEFINLLNASYLAKEEKRFEILKKAEALFIDEMPLAPIYHWNFAILSTPSLKGVFVSPIGMVHFEEAYFEP